MIFDECRLDQFKEEYIGTDILDIKPFDGGLNSHLFKVIKKREAETMILKFYRLRSEEDQRDRCGNEVNALQYLKKLRLNNIPSIIDFNRSQSWLLMTEIKGNKVNILNDQYLQDIVDFIVNSNKKLAEEDKILAYASDPLLSLESYLLNIKMRCADLSNMLKAKSSKDDLIKIIDILCKDIESEINKINKEFNQDIGQFFCFSQSDVGIHNCLSTSEGLAFIDFEYSGIDHISKLLADWIVHPEYPMNTDEENTLINGILNSGLYRQNGWVNLIKEIKPITSLKWCLLIIKKGIISENPDDICESFDSYYQKVTAPLINRVDHSINQQ